VGHPTTSVAPLLRGADGAARRPLPFAKESSCSLKVKMYPAGEMGSLKKRRKAKINRHKRRKKLRMHRHKKRTWQA